MSTDSYEMTSTERAVLITVRLVDGERLTNAQVAAICGYARRNSAYYLMMRLARVLPLVYCAGEWRIDERSKPVNA